MRHFKLPIYFLCLLFLACSCRYTRSNRLFQTNKDLLGDSLLHRVKLAEKTYLLRKNDFITFQVFTNKGEVVVDPTGKIPSKYSVNTGTNNTQLYNLVEKYLIYDNGLADLPMVGSIRLEGLSLHQCDSLLSKEYSKFYQEAYVITRCINKRVILTGAFGSKIIPLLNENMNLIEVLALTEQMGTATSTYAKFHNIRLIRGDLKNPNVYLIDLTTIEGLKKANLNIQPNDIIYVEPYRRIFFETVKDFTPILSFMTSILTLTFVIIYGRR